MKNTNIFFTIFLFFAALTLAAQNNYSPCYTNNMSKGNAAFSQGKYSEARTYYVTAKQCAGGNPTEAQKKISACDAKIKAQKEAAEAKKRAEEEAAEAKKRAEQETEEAKNAEIPIRFAEEMPEFPGGMEAMYSFLRNELQYPAVARVNNIQGTVLLEFVVEKDGSISNAKPLVSLYPECDAEAIRIVNKMPKWKPAKQNGKPVRCYFNLPIRFKLL